jgi:hypothetical protein
MERPGRLMHGLAAPSGATESEIALEEQEIA